MSDAHPALAATAATCAEMRSELLARGWMVWIQDLDTLIAAGTELLLAPGARAVNDYYAVQLLVTSHSADIQADLWADAQELLLDEYFDNAFAADLITAPALRLSADGVHLEWITAIYDGPGPQTGPANALGE